MVNESIFQKEITGRVAVFIDAANVIYCQKDLGWKIDFKKVKRHFVSLANLLRGKKKRFVVVSTRWHIAKDLIDASDTYVDLKKLRSIWSR